MHVLEVICKADDHLPQPFGLGDYNMVVVVEFRNLNTLTMSRIS